MIKISIQECQVFDMLSIIEIKIENARVSGNREKLLELSESKRLLIKEITGEIGGNKFMQAYYSPQYSEIYKSNQETFDLIDRAKNDNGLAKITDEANYKRHGVKKKFQEVIFGNKIS